MKLLRTVTALFFCLTLIPFSTYAATVLRLAYAENSQPVKDALRFLGQQIEEKTHGEVQVMYFPDGQLGSERELVELAQAGVVDITKVSSGLMESFSPLYGVFSLPYLFTDKAEFYRVMDNDRVMDPVYQSTAAQGFIGVGWYDSGARNFYMSKAPIRSIEDLQGKKIRVMQSDTAIRTLKMLGASPIAMSQAEVYTSLQQGILDGAENNEFALTIARHGEVARFYTYDMHTRIPDILLMSNLAFEKLTTAQQKIIREAIKASIEYEKAAWDAEIEKTKKEAVKNFNVEFFEIDKKPFQQAVQPIYDGLKDTPQLYGLYQTIQSAK
ncbi:putative rhamnogalacturonide-specific TRAP-type transporter substrate-binding subunit [Buttiauxella gaviniae ATCC 51604]|uniref:Putative rhamnogalacturonide-specific TRAP-type transporter substrate-binding subunit n=1 Tax=Buttiauxella gaviniae ATCC 51604 TaxID=1354253 RepID=A0A1B7I141_9ENTR|nr:TRAP transporter substrate-binding protein [Buttiauxella gaviniae]OAT21755.1 putative rhamnogalacturonide-specific TRAP-type transporter substrate-binding subunit [Buttiauxella gaviniae ATCC 51604]